MSRVGKELYEMLFKHYTKKQVSKGLTLNVSEYREKMLTFILFSGTNTPPSWTLPSWPAYPTERTETTGI